MSDDVQESKERGGIYTRVTFPALSLKPGQRVLVDVSLPGSLNDKERAAGKKAKPLEGRQLLTVGPVPNDLGLLRVNLRD